MVAVAVTRARGAVAGVVLALLLLVSIWIGWRLALQVSGFRRDLREPQPQTRTVLGTVLGISGVEGNGHTFAGTPPGTKRIVVFAMTGASLPAEVAFWRQVHDRVPAGTALLGMCADQECTDLAQRLSAGFTVLMAADANGISAVQRANRVGGFFGTDNRARVLAEPKLAGQSPEEVLAEIERAK